MAKNHIALPKSSLMRFSKNGSVKFLDLQNNRIRRAFAKTYNTAMDYYPDETEDFLQKAVETPLGKLYEALEDFSNNKSSYIYPPQIKESLIVNIAIQYLRAPNASRFIKTQSIFARLLNLPDLHCSPLHRIDLPLTEQAIDIFREVFQNHEVNICIVNKDNCSSSFVLPTCHYYGIGPLVFFILSPYHAFVLIPKELNDIYRTGDRLRYFRVNNNNDFESQYKEIIKQELVYGDGKLIGLEEQLKIIQEYRRKVDI